MAAKKLETLGLEAGIVKPKRNRNRPDMDALKLWTTLFLLGMSFLHAQEATPVTVVGIVKEEVSEIPRDIKNEVWTADMPAGKYIVRLSAITSVSMHEYVVDGSVRVIEVNVGTKGSELARFYYLEPNTPQAPGGIGQSAIDKVKERAEEASDRLGASTLWQKVTKNYPTTTHARTIEYRVGSKDDLKKLFESVEKSWLDGEGRTFKLNP